MHTGFRAPCHQKLDPRIDLGRENVYVMELCAMQRQEACRVHLATQKCTVLARFGHVDENSFIRRVWSVTFSEMEKCKGKIWNLARNKDPPTLGEIE